ncbi:MAG: phage holin family protein [Proteobacteria bacterium]|nr:phage holin family protein [Pseudomonadota bacterium]
MNKTTILILGAGFGAVITFVFGAAEPYITTLLIFVCIDTVMGFMLARQNGGATSKGFGKVFPKIAWYGLSLFALNRLIVTFGLSGNMVVIGVCAIIFREAFSILEKLKASGYLPQVFIDIFDKIVKSEGKV